MHVLITGGLGFIGSHTVVALIQRGYNVTIVDNLSNSSIKVLQALSSITKKHITFYNIDVSNENEMRLVFEKNTFDAVIHFAGFKAVGESVATPLKYYFNNIVTTLCLAKLCELYNVKKIVFSSSATVYGENTVPFYETTPLLPSTNPYGESKVMCERILIDLSKSNNSFEISILRYFNPIGAHESGLIGDLTNGPPNNLMPYITQVAVGKLINLKIFGNDYNTIDGTGVRDYIHVVDLAEGHVSALQHLKKGAHIYNLGTGVGTSVLELIYAFEKATGLKIPYETVDRRPGDIACAYANVDKAYKQLGWKARRTIEEMCKDAWNFELKNTNLNSII